MQPFSYCLFLVVDKLIFIDSIDVLSAVLHSLLTFYFTGNRLLTLRLVALCTIQVGFLCVSGQLFCKSQVVFCTFHVNYFIRGGRAVRALGWILHTSNRLFFRGGHAMHTTGWILLTSDRLLCTEWSCYARHILDFACLKLGILNNVVTLCTPLFGFCIYTILFRKVMIVI